MKGFAQACRLRLTRFRRTPAFTGFVLFMGVLLLNIIIAGPSTIFNPRSLNTLFTKNVPFLLICMAQGLLLITGTLDISIGLQIAMVNVIAIMAPQELGVPIYMGWLLAVFSAILASVVCGVFISAWKLPAMLASYSLTFIIKGVNVLIMPSPQGSVPKVLYKAYDSLLFGVLPVSAIIVAAVFLAWIYTKHTRFGKHIYAVGSDQRNSFAAGINPRRVQMSAFIIKGIIIGIAGISLTLMTTSGNPLQAEDYGLRSLSACIIGGLGFGGWGSLGCALFGGGFMVLISNVVYYLFTLLFKLIPGFQVNSYWQNLISDVIISLGLLMTIITRRGQREALKQGFVKFTEKGLKE